MQQRMSQGAMAALQRAMGQYGPGPAAGGVAPQLDAGALQPPMQAAPVGGAPQPMMTPPPVAQAQSPAPQQPEPPPVMDDMAARAQRIVREAQTLGDASPETLKALVDELFSFLSEGQRNMIAARAAQMAGAGGPAQPQQAMA